MDITRLILDDHHAQRHRFALLEQVDPSDTKTLGPLWDRLAVFLELHALAEEKIFYPQLLKIGKGAGDKKNAAAETRDAISDHNDIRDAVAKVADHEVGADSWFTAIAAVNKANSDHMGEEERESLADFRRHASLQKRHELGVAFVTFEAQNYQGVKSKDKDPESYVKEHK